MLKTVSCYAPIILLVVLLGHTDIQACSCARPPLPCEAYGGASAVFLGLVVDSVHQKSVDRDGVKTVYDVGTIRFAVQESFKGITTREVEIHSGTGGGDCGYWFLRGQVYLVYAYKDSEDGKLWTNICTRTSLRPDAGDDLKFLHGLNSAKPGATLFGVLRRILGDPYHGPFRQAGPMSDIRVIIEGDPGRFETVTNAQGEYTLSGLPPGKYDARPVLPENLGAIAQHDTVDRFGSYSGHAKMELANLSCAEMSFRVQSNGVISGQIKDQEGKAIKDLKVDLVKSDDLKKDWAAWTDENGHYEFHMVQPDAYLLGVNLSWVPSKDTPYPRTFFKATGVQATNNQSEATVIVVGDGTRLQDYDLMLPPRFTERTVAGTVSWSDGRPGAKAMVHYELIDYPGSSLGENEDADDNGHFALKLFDGLRYTVYASGEISEREDMHSDPIEITAGENVPKIKFVLNKPGYGSENSRIFKEAKTAAQTPSSSPTPAATPPPSDVFLIDVKTKVDREAKTEELKFGEPKKINDVAGYNNQPFFMPDGKAVLYTSFRNKQTDIYRYDLSIGATTQVTNTPESEYSATLMPDKKNISVVRVEADGTQRLWKFPLAGGSPSLVIENIKPVGYHHWIDDHTVALFVLGGTGKPNFLEVYDLRTGKSEFVVENPGRVLRKVPNQNSFSFVHKVSDKSWEIKAFDLRKRTSASMIATLPGVEDYAWLPSGKLIMAKDSKLFAVLPLSGAQWEEVADFSKAGIKRITRIAANSSGGRIAVVGVMDQK